MSEAAIKGYPLSLAKYKALPAWILFSAVLLSGIAGLGYQMAWTRLLSVSLGHEFTAVLAVVAAFFVGLALGGLLFNKRLKTTAQPLRWYVSLEIVIGLWALLLVQIMPFYNHWLAQAIGSQPHPLWHWSIAFAGSLLLLLPATMAMGATLPAAHRVAQNLGLHGGDVAGLYGLNTAGALLGTLLATYWLLPKLGLTLTLAAFAVINLSIAGLLWFGLPKRAKLNAAPNDDHHCASSREGGVGKNLLLVLGLTGLLGLGYEILVVRVLAQILEGTVYSFAAVLAVYLLGTAVGATGYHYCARRWQRAGTSISEQAVNRWLLAALALTCLLGTAMLWVTQAVYQIVVGFFGFGNVAAMLAELSVAVVVFLVPTLLMGAMFCHLAQQAVARQGLGAAFGFNTFGAALAPLLFGVVLLPVLGALPTLMLLSVGYALLPGLLGGGRSNWLVPLPALACAVLLLVVSGPLRFVSAPDGSQLLHYKEGVIAAVAVIEEPDKSRHLKVNNRFTMGGTASRFSDHRQTHLPMLWQGGTARSALYLGLGTGVTFQAAQYYPQLHATGVELIPEMLPLMPAFGVDVGASHWHNKPQVLAADARRFVVADDHLYDVIIAEVFHPSRDGAGSLYTVEHFQAIRQRLTPDGLFCQWLPLFQLDIPTLRLITRSFLEVFPQAQLHLAHFSLRQPLLCLLGGQGEISFSDNWLLPRVHDRNLQQQLVQARLNSDFALFGGFLAGAPALTKFTQGVPLNTDDFPRVIFQAPSFVYGQPQSPGQRLLELVEILAADRGTLLSPDQRYSDFNQRLENYWRARDQFLAAGVDVVPSADIRQMISQTAEPLLEAVAISNDFMPAYDPLLQMAQAVYATNPQQARSLLMALDQANPTLPDARRLLQQLFPARVQRPREGMLSP